MLSLAFWIDPKGKFIETGSNHIIEIIKKPKEFGFTKEEVQAAFDKYKEPLGKEGLARRELIDKAIGRGWIRMRLYKNSHWSITIARLDSKTKKKVTVWAKKLLSGGFRGLKQQDPFLLIKFTALVSRMENKQFTVKDVADGKLISTKSTIVEKFREYIKL